MCHEAGEKDVRPQSASNILWCSPSTRTIPSADAPVCEHRVTSILACLLTIPLWRHVGILLPNSLPAYNKKVGNWTNYWCILPAFIPTLFYRQGTKSLARKGLYLVWNSSHIWPEEWRQGGKVGMERTNRHYVRHCARPSSYIRPLNLHRSNIIIFFLHKRKQTQKSYMTCWDSNSEMLDSKTMQRPPREGDGNPLQYSCLENSINRRSWLATVHRVTKSWTWLKWLNTQSTKDNETVTSVGSTEE